MDDDIGYIIASAFIIFIYIILIGSVLTLWNIVAVLIILVCIVVLANY